MKIEVLKYQNFGIYYECFVHISNRLVCESFNNDLFFCPNLGRTSNLFTNNSFESRIDHFKNRSPTTIFSFNFGRISDSFINDSLELLINRCKNHLRTPVKFLFQWQKNLKFAYNWFVRVANRSMYESFANYLFLFNLGRILNLFTINRSNHKSINVWIVRNGHSFFV